MTAPVPRSVSSSLESGSPRRRPHEEATIFIVCREAFRALTSTILKRSNPTTLAPGGHEPQGSFLPFKIDPHVSLSHWDVATLRFAKVRNVHG